jgi:uncharacterized membrane protein
VITQYEELDVSFHGPLPPPAMLAQYNDAYPGCAEAIVKMAVSQSEHRQHLEKRVVDAQIVSERIGQFSALLIGVGGATVSALLVWNDKNIQGFVLALGEIAVFAGIYFYSKKTSRQELQTKRESAAE